MHARQTALLLATLLLTLSACSTQPPPYTLNSHAFSRPLELTIKGAEPEQARRAAETALEDLLFVAEVSHPWKPGPLGRTNQLLAFEAEFSANPSVLPMIRRATELTTLSRGYYAPALGGLQQLWGFHSELPTGPVPEAEKIAALVREQPQMADIRIDGIRMQGTNPALRIDFGPFAQGFALDTARLRLRENAIEQAKLDNGNAIAVLGGDWTVEFGPDAEETLLLHNGEALVTLSVEERAFTVEGRRYHPYLNPHTGYPSEGLHSVTVVHRSAATAAALAQALLSAGETKLAELLQVLPVEYAQVITTDGRRITTPAMAQRLHLVRD